MELDSDSSNEWNLRLELDETDHEHGDTDSYGTVYGSENSATATTHPTDNVEHDKNLAHRDHASTCTSAIFDLQENERLSSDQQVLQVEDSKTMISFSGKHGKYITSLMSMT